MEGKNERMDCFSPINKDYNVFYECCPTVMETFTHICGNMFSGGKLSAEQKFFGCFILSLYLMYLYDEKGKEGLRELEEAYKKAREI